MKEKINLLIEKLNNEHSLKKEEYKYLVENRSKETTELLKTLAVKARKRVYGNSVYIRGLIEFSNICKNDCYYCGIRRSNKSSDRYRLTKEQIIDTANQGYELGFRTIVLQSGEDSYFTDDVLVEIIRNIKQNHPDCAVTLSIGERNKESYQRLFDAGADRFLLRHETADKEHYEKLHPNEMSFEHRMQNLQELKEIGYQVGCGFMVGSPFQSTDTIVKDLKFIEEFSPEMCGIGPFIPHKATPFKEYKAGTVELTCYLLSIIRLIKPNILLPATTALGTIQEGGREQGILSGANVVMPNLSPMSVRKKYDLYDNKLCTGEESAQGLSDLKNKIKAIGYEIVVDRGDIKEGKF